MDYKMKSIATEKELDQALSFAKRIFGNAPYINTGEYTKEKWLARIERDSDLMLYAQSGDKIVGIALGWIGTDGNLTIGSVAVESDYRKLGIARELLRVLEERAIAKGVHLISLGAVQSAEQFYMKCGYTPFLFIQGKPPQTLDGFRALNPGYREVWSYDNGADIRLMLAVHGIDHELQQAYSEAFPGCSTQTVFMKSI